MQPPIGKLVGEHLYIHSISRQDVPGDLKMIIDRAQVIAPEAFVAANVFKIDARNRIVSLLSYPRFFQDPFPELAEGWRIHVEGERVTYRSYAESLNPPILHRKELLLPLDHPGREVFVELTKQAEQLGLFADKNLIGFKRSWEEKIRAAGLYLDGHNLQPLGNDISPIQGDGEEDDVTSVQRHRTALSRTGLSAPMQAVARHGLLNADTTVFDYGCGRGDDIAALRANSIPANGWDPYFAPENDKQAADIVNLGFVVNVIEDFDERIFALRSAFSLANQLLVVSTMLYGGAPPPGQPYRDGYLTARRTFQKYFTQAELKEFVESVLDTEAIAVAPGIMFVFADKQAEQRFLYGRQRSHHALKLLGYRRAQTLRTPRPPRVSKREAQLAEYGDLIDRMWGTMLRLGRLPEPFEFADSASCVDAFSSWSRAVRFVLGVKDPSEFQLAADERRADLLVYLALQVFSRRKPYRQLDDNLQRDIKAHFGDYQKALASAQTTLLNAADPESLNDACRSAQAKGLGHYVDSDYLQLHISSIERLPAVLRIYVGCGLILYGDMDGVDLVKIHVRSGKLTLMKFDDFDGKPIPLMSERIKIRLRDQEIDFFLYGSSHEPHPLYCKSRFLNDDYPMFEQQARFDEQLDALHLFDPDSYGPPLAELQAALAQKRLEVQGFNLAPASSIPDLDQACGTNFTYRQLIECGDTWHRTHISNIPRQPATFNALHALATEALDPIVEYFGMIRLTYGFASAALTKEIPAGIAPHLDQHAAHELNRGGRPVCPRLGAAVDFLVEDEDMLEVARWITGNIPFDRLYVYGRQRPLHISYGPELARQIVVMSPSGSNGRLVPRIMAAEKLATFQWSESSN